MVNRKIETQAQPSTSRHGVLWRLHGSILFNWRPPSETLAEGGGRANDHRESSVTSTSLSLNLGWRPHCNAGGVGRLHGSQERNHVGNETNLMHGLTRIGLHGRLGDLRGSIDSDLLASREGGAGCVSSDRPSRAIVLDENHLHDTKPLASLLLL